VPVLIVLCMFQNRDSRRPRSESPATQHRRVVTVGRRVYPTRERRQVVRPDVVTASAISGLSTSQSSRSRSASVGQRVNKRHRQHDDDDEEYMPAAPAPVLRVPTGATLEATIALLCLVFKDWIDELDNVPDAFHELDTAIRAAYMLCDPPFLGQPDMDDIDAPSSAVLFHSHLRSWNELPAAIQPQFAPVIMVVYTRWRQTLSRKDQTRFLAVRRQLQEGLQRTSGPERALRECTPFTLGEMSACRHCGSFLWAFEHHGPNRGWLCCGDGKYVVRRQDAPSLPPDLRQMYSNRVLVKYCRRINHLLSFTAIGTSPTRAANGRGFYSLPFPSVVRLEGKSYHLMVPANVHGPMHFYVVSDGSTAVDPRLQAAKIPAGERAELNMIVDRLRDWIRNHHILRDALRSMSEVQNLFVEIVAFCLFSQRFLLCVCGCSGWWRNSGN